MQMRIVKFEDTKKAVGRNGEICMNAISVDLVVLFKDARSFEVEIGTNT